MLYCYIVLVLTNKKVGVYLALCESNMIHLYAIALFLPSKFTLHTNDCSSCSTPYNRSLALKQARFLRAFIVHTQRYAYKLAFIYFFSSVRFSSKCAIFSGVSILCCVFCFSSSVFYRCVHSTSSFRTFSIKQTVFFVVGCFVWVLSVMQRARRGENACSLSSQAFIISIFSTFLSVLIFFRLAAEIFISNSFSVLVSVLKSKYTGIERERKGKEWEIYTQGLRWTVRSAE